VTLTDLRLFKILRAKRLRKNLSQSIRLKPIRRSHMNQKLICAKFPEDLSAESARRHPVLPIRD